MPLIRRLPKRGFNNAAFHKTYAIVNLDATEQLSRRAPSVNEQLLRESNLIRGHGAGIKILGDGELKQALTIEADKISASAREKIEKAGGTVTMRAKPAALAAPRRRRSRRRPNRSRSAPKAKNRRRKKAVGEKENAGQKRAKKKSAEEALSLRAVAHKS